MKIPIVDEEDNIINNKEREEVKTKDIYRVSALWLTNSDDEILLARRALTKTHDPGKWGPAVAGTVEEGESYEINIIKEIEEELGLKDIKLKKGEKKRRTGKHNFFCQWYLATVNMPLKEFKVHEGEIEEIKWFSKEELKKQVEENPDNFLKSVQQWIKLLV